ncbi:hypothetical protein FSP39_018613 [Pinctada imbricata]|uniref:Serpin domain-containing protein n=1 Tax=Pinctada imbricata TaxID=66713 RepID=A0AA88YB18_PINIB|nr:hypothetical protein FSP39_018613 [Pinctada imbricata]
MAEQAKQQGTFSMNDAMSDFSLQLYRKLSNTSTEGSNLFLSPYSVSSALMLTMLGCAGSSEEQLRNGLCLKSSPGDSAHEEYQGLRKALNEMSGDNCKLAIANRIFAKTGLDVVEDYKKRAKEWYGSEMELLDFVGDSEGSRQRINGWVEEQTNNKIKDLIPSGGINALSIIVLTNAIYFKGNWEKKFEKEATQKTPFKISKSESVDVDMMYMNEEKWQCGESESLNCKMLELPYKGRQLSLIILLPNKIDGLKELESKLSLSMLKTLRNEMFRQEADVALPKFKLESTFELAQVLPEMGITDIFSAQKANFSGMLKSQPPNTAVSNVIHKAFVEVNEEGTEAAAATAVMVRLMCMPMGPKFEFIADHPFLFIIQETGSGTVLFIGRHVNPKQ